MKRRITFSLLFLALVMLVTACGGQPLISLASTQLNLGDVVNGVVVTRELDVQNDGQADLIIEAVTTSCGCTQATIDPMTITPGNSGTLRITFDSGAHGPDLTGPLVRQVFIASNDRQKPEASIELVANILPPEER